MTYLKAAQSVNSPIVIKHLLMLLDKRKNAKNGLEGYLKLKDGPGDFVKFLFCARNTYLSNEKNFLLD